MAVAVTGGKGWVAAAIAVPAAIALSVPLALVAAAPSLTLLSSRSSTDGSCTVAPGTAVAAIAAPRTGSRWAADQRANVGTVISVGKAHGIPERGWLIATEVILVESEAHNLNHGDRDSRGLFQQRPSAGWGTYPEITNPVLATEAFYGVAKHTNNRGLVDVYNWQNKPMGEVAQSVQVSAFPDRYADREADARELVALASGVAPAPCEPAPITGTGGGPTPASFDKLGNPRTVDEAIAWLAKMDRDNSFTPVNSCAHQMAVAYGWPNSGCYPNQARTGQIYGGCTALALFDAMPAAIKTKGMSAPPRGALVFWETGNPAGHIAISAGGGMVYSTDAAARAQITLVPIGMIDKWGPRQGWTSPYWPIHQRSID